MWQVVLGITPATVTLFLLAAMALALALALWAGRAPERAAPRRTAGVLLGCWLVVVLVATLAPSQPIGSGDATVWWLPGEGLFDPGAPLLPLELSMLVRQQLANAALFLPVPMLLRFALPGRSVAAAFLAGVGLCVLIEVGQLMMRAGRVADVNDVLCGAAGTGIGLGLAGLARLAAAFMRRRGPRRRVARAAP
ncbi:VanZ family protein [Streptomyces pinistramenti]|uniref:VanZ family protein n=1 Tax=Streptomyces pinistramenti TaxID=2884812 RepID=UPI001D0878AE|nr:VanZ family protein [Streptomyces pinistramenti]MCB5911143.1 VanZ family protein [Streptomyces pinistramenti]